MEMFDNWWTMQDSHMYALFKPVTVQDTDAAIISIAFDDVRGYIYWNEDYDIYSGTLNGSQSEKLFNNGTLCMCIYFIK